LTLNVELRESAGIAVISRPDASLTEPWTELSRVARDLDPTALVRDYTIELRWPWFLYLTGSLAHLQQQFGFSTSYSSAARDRLAVWVAESASVAAALVGARRPALFSGVDALEERLAATGWDLSRRKLTVAQVRDTLAASALEHHANFSVPGAGKTTTALAVHLVTAEDLRLLVVAPKNAFPAWDQTLEDCLVAPYDRFVRLVGGREAIRKALSADPKRSIIGYGQLLRVPDLLSDHLATHKVHLILDESHRIKSGNETMTGAAALSLSPFALRRDILSGTPMPNGAVDLAAQFEFLWPADGLGPRIEASQRPGSVIRGLYARTTKNELDLPPLETDYVAIDMSDPQRVLYGLMADDALRQLRGSVRAGAVLSGANVSVMRLLQAAIDPQAAVRAILRAGDAGFADGDVLRTVCRLVLEEDVSPRMQAVEQHVRRLAAAGDKVVVWVPFLDTIDHLVERLSDLGAFSISGRVEAGEEDEVDTREWVVRRFHDDPRRMVLVANPAAGGEGISLHQVCHNAIYLGRTYNAAHFLQSRDRIHRLGLPDDVVTRIWIYEVTSSARFGSIDMSVRNRLDAKIQVMSEVLNDPDLRELSLESLSADPSLDDGFGFQDMVDLIRELGARVNETA
jgi:hypothetical protein